jgi:hypothetical protein
MVQVMEVLNFKPQDSTKKRSLARRLGSNTVVECTHKTLISIHNSKKQNYKFQIIY